MALQPDIQYVPFYYVEGSAARKVERRSESAKAPVPTPAPQRRRAKRKTVVVDPVAITGLLVVMVLLVSLMAGWAEHHVLQERNAQMSQYITELETENAQLQQQYQDGYDLDEIRQIAGALGMVPSEHVEQITIDVQLPQEEQVQMSFWESVTTFLAGLFA